MNEFPHFCQDGHPKIGHAENYEPEELACPVCRQREKDARIAESFESVFEISPDALDSDGQKIAKKIREAK